MNTVLARKVKTAREASGLTVRQISAKLGIRPERYSEYEDGYTVPRLGILFRFASIVKADVHYFLNEGIMPDMIMEHSE